jgi:Lysylphosphatidylglycerol synthase TM region
VVGRQVHLGRLRGLVASMDLGLFAMAVSYTLVVSGLKPLRWLWLLRGVLPQTSYGVALRSSLMGTGARLLLPGKIGEFVRVLAVDGLKPLPGAGLTAMDLVMEATAAFALAIPGALILGGSVAATAALFLTTIGGLVLFYPHHVLAPLTRLPGLGGLSERMEGVRQVVESIGRPTLWKGLGLSVVTNLLRFAQLYVIFVALGTVPNGAALVFFPLLGLADGFPLTVGGLGAREWLSAQILPTCSIPSETAVAAVLLAFAVSTLLPGVLGWWLTFRRRKSASA